MKQSATLSRKNTLIVGKPAILDGEVVDYTDAEEIAVNHIIKYLSLGFKIIPDEYIRAMDDRSTDRIDDDDTEIDIKDISKKELLAIANEMGLEVASNATKADIANAIGEEQ